MRSALRNARLHVVTGKGGTGKTTAAASLALALAGGGRRVLLCEVEGRQGIASVFDVAPLPYVERRIAIGPDGGEIWALAIDAEAALLEYLDSFYHLGRAGKAMDRFGVIDFATTIAPGVRDVLLIGKVYEATRRKAGGRSGSGRSTYDAVVLDAPPTGRIGRFLNVNTEVVGLAKVGPVRNQASSIMTLLKSDQSLVHFVTTLEEMPVQEALDGIEEMATIGLSVGAVDREHAAPADAGARRSGDSRGRWAGHGPGVGLAHEGGDHRRRRAAGRPGGRGRRTRRPGRAGAEPSERDWRRPTCR